MAFLVSGKRLEKRSTPNLPMVTIQQLATVSRPNNRETGGLEDTRTDHLKLHQLEELSVIDPMERLLLRALRSLANASRYWLAEVALKNQFMHNCSLGASNLELATRCESVFAFKFCLLLSSVLLRLIALENWNENDVLFSAWHRNTKNKEIQDLSTEIEPITFRLLVRLPYHYATGDSGELFMWETS